MSNYVNVNGVWREAWSVSINVNGVWRDSDSLVNINGVMRESFTHEIEEEDIVGFRMVYKRNQTKKHPEFPHLKFNPNLPVITSLTGETPGFMDLNEKGFVFQYERDHVDEEGICVYDGTLYAVLINDALINVCETKDTSGQDDRIPIDIPSISEAWSTNRVQELKIQLQGMLMFDSHGYYMSGWNNLFGKDQFIDTSDYTIKDNKNYIYLNSYNILPISNRNERFNTLSSIGIARDMHTVDVNMVGSYGVLDHTISWISVNDIKKPFVIEVYD